MAKDNATRMANIVGVGLSVLLLSFALSHEETTESVPQKQKTDCAPGMIEGEQICVTPSPEAGMGTTPLCTKRCNSPHTRRVKQEDPDLKTCKSDGYGDSYKITFPTKPMTLEQMKAGRVPAQGSAIEEPNLLQRIAGTLKEIFLPRYRDPQPPSGMKVDNAPRTFGKN